MFLKRFSVRATVAWSAYCAAALAAAAQPAILTNAPASAPAALTNAPAAPANAPAAGAPRWLTQPLSMVDSVNLALQHNSSVLKSLDDLEASHGLVLQTRAVAMPKVRSTGNYTATDAGLTEQFPFNPGGAGISMPSERWTLSLQLVQSVYDGGRLRSAMRSSRLLREQALLQHQAVLNDVVTEVGVAYANVLAAADEIQVRQKSVELLTRELDDMKRRFEAGTVPRFNVLRAEVELANARPKLSTARNTWRIAKNTLVNLLGMNLPATVLEDIPIHLTDTLKNDPYEVQLPAAIAQAWDRRPEIQALRKAEKLRQEDIVTAKAGYKPTVELFTGYQSHNSSYSDDLTREVHGWDAGAQFNWNIFDGLATKGRVQQAKAVHNRAKNEIDETLRRIELEVRTAYSTFLEANEILGATGKVVEQAEEALRLAKARAEAGTSTQLDVLTAETSLTEAGNTRNVALREYMVARIRLQRAIGQPIVSTAPAGLPPAKPAPAR